MGAVFKAFQGSNTDMKVNRRAKHTAQQHNVMMNTFYKIKKVGIVNFSSNK